MKYKMTSVKNQKTATGLVAIAALAGVLVVSTLAIGSGHIALADNDNAMKVFNNDYGTGTGTGFSNAAVVTNSQT